MRYDVGLLFVFLAASPALAEKSCQNAMTQVEINQCAHDDYMQEDKRLNETYSIIVSELQKQQKTEPSQSKFLDETLSSLRKGQRSWVKFRDDWCNYIAHTYEGGSIQPTIRYSCLATLTKEQISRLQELSLSD